MKEGTIAAISTPLMTGAVGIVRISGEKADSVLRARFTPVSRTRIEDFMHGKLYYGTFDCGRFSDRCLAVLFRAPHSYTGEDMAEIQCHGGVEVVRGVLNAVLSEEGVRLAEPGEFTRRAFVNGKQDLSSCEGIGDMIQAESAAELSAADALARGELFRIVQRLQDSLTDWISYAEVLLDYPEEDVPARKIEEIETFLSDAEAEIGGLLSGYDTGRKLKAGVTVALCGLANAGKSSLFNALLKFDRAIVTEIPGTTRDTIEGFLECEGIKIRLVDTAGVRETSDEIERQGVRRSLDEIRDADLVLFVFDGTDADADRELLARAGENVLTVRSKADLGNAAGAELAVSATTGQNLEELKKQIVARTVGRVPSGLILTSERHFSALLRAKEFAARARTDLAQKPFDILAHELRETWDALGEITGTAATEEIIDNIFRKFCLGK